MLVMEHLVIVQARGEQVVGSLKGRLACILHAGLRKGYQVISLLTCCLLHKRELLEVKLRIFAFPFLKTKETKSNPLDLVLHVPNYQLNQYLKPKTNNRLNLSAKVHLDLQLGVQGPWPQRGGT